MPVCIIGISLKPETAIRNVCCCTSLQLREEGAVDVGPACITDFIEPRTALLAAHGLKFRHVYVLTQVFAEHRDVDVLREP